MIAPPFPWFGGKSKVADLVWSRFGDVKNYVEPFFGSGAVLLNRPHWPFEKTRIETANDLDCYLANFWRALRDDPEQVSYFADWPVNEADLHARHWWLVRQDGFREKMRTDPDYYDAQVAGWWAWGICQWIGSGWCQYPEWQQRPHLGNPDGRPQAIAAAPPPGQISGNRATETKGQLVRLSLCYSRKTKGRSCVLWRLVAGTRPYTDHAQRLDWRIP